LLKGREVVGAPGQAVHLPTRGTPEGLELLK
jgi:hypothetical protein